MNRKKWKSSHRIVHTHHLHQACNQSIYQHRQKSKLSAPIFANKNSLRIARNTFPSIHWPLTMPMLHRSAGPTQKAQNERRSRRRQRRRIWIELILINWYCFWYRIRRWMNKCSDSLWMASSIHQKNFRFSLDLFSLIQLLWSMKRVAIPTIPFSGA